MEYLFHYLKYAATLLVIALLYKYRIQVKFILCMLYMFYLYTFTAQVSGAYVYPDTRVNPVFYK